MKLKISKPKGKLKYEPDEKIEYKITTFRLPVKMLKDLNDWAEECSDDTNDGSLNDLVKRVLQWGIEHKEK